LANEGFRPSVPWDAKPGEVIECENCAGVLFRLIRNNVQDALGIVHLVSCPYCGKMIRIDDDTPEGSLVYHGGVSFTLAKEFGAFSLELVDGQRPGCTLDTRPNGD
jgi:hypothetical protein